MVYNIARRYAFSSKNRHRLTSLRIAIGLLFSTLALNIIIAYMLGLQDRQFSMIREYSSYDAIIELNDNNEVDKYINELNNNENITYAFKFLELPAIINNSNNAQLFGQIRGFKSDDFDNLPYSIVRGNFSSDGISLGYSSENNSFNFQEIVDLTVLKKGQTVTIVPYQAKKEISSIFFTPLLDFNNYYILTSYNNLKSIAPYALDKIGVYGDIETIRQIIGNNGVVSSWIDQNQSLYAAMKLEQYLMYFTIFLMSIIILIQLYNSTINLITSKRSEIAMLRALGLTKIQIKRIFLISAFIVSSTGIILGSFLSFILLKFSTTIIGFINVITQYNIPILSVNVNLTFSLINCIIIALPLFILTFLLSNRAIKKLLKNDSMEILLNE